MEKEFGKWSDIDVKYVGSLSKDEIREIMFLRDEGKTSKEISNYLGRTLIVINQVIQENAGFVGIPKQLKEVETTVPIADTLDDIRDSDIVKLSRKLLNAMVESTGLTQTQEMTPRKLSEAKVLLGFLNSNIHAIKTKMQFFKMIGMDEKIKAVKDHSDNL